MSEDDLVCSEIFVNGMNYHNGDLIVNEVLEGGGLRFGISRQYLIGSNKLILLLLNMQSKTILDILSLKM